MQNEFDYRKYLGLINKYKHLFAITSLAIMTVVVVASYVLPKKYMAQSIIYVSRGVLNNLVSGIAAVTPTVEDTLRGLDTAIKSRPLLSKVASELDLDSSKNGDAQLNGMIEKLRNNTDIKLNDKEGLITITATDQSPRVVRDYINMLVRCYIEENLSKKREESYGASSFLSEQIVAIKEKMDKVDTELGKIRREKGVSLPSDAGGQFDINAAQQRLDELALRRSQLEITRSQLKNNSPARARLLALQRRLEELRVEYTDNYPEVIKIKSDIEVAQRELGRGTMSNSISEPQELARTDAELNAVKVSEARQHALIASNRGGGRGRPVENPELEKLEQERNNLRNLYDQLMTKKNQAEVSKQMEVQDKAITFKIIEPALLPTVPVSPNRIRMILMGIASGIVGGFGLLLLIDFFDKSVKNINELKTLGVKIIAVIPKIIDPSTIESEKRKDFRLYVIAGTYFSVIVLLLGLELLGISPVDKFVGFF